MPSAYHFSFKPLVPSACLSPDGALAPYSKRALWGWDRDHFVAGEHPGVYTIDGVKLGLRICFEIRFPEYFRELFQAQAQLVCVSFCDVASQPHQARYELIKAHLLTRAVENGYYILAANGIAPYQTAPTCLIDPDGNLLEIAPQDQEYLLTFTLPEPSSNFGREGRISISRQLATGP